MNGQPDATRELLRFVLTFLTLGVIFLKFVPAFFVFPDFADYIFLQQECYEPVVFTFWPGGELPEFLGDFTLTIEGENRGPQVRIVIKSTNAKAAQPRFSPVFGPFFAPATL